MCFSLKNYTKPFATVIYALMEKIECHVMKEMWQNIFSSIFSLAEDFEEHCRLGQVFDFNYKKLLIS